MHMKNSSAPAKIFDMSVAIGEPNISIVEIQGRRYRKRDVENKSTITLGDFMSGKTLNLC